MTTYTTIPDSDIDPESPITSTLITRLRDNAIAIKENASGSPAEIDNSGANAIFTQNGIWNKPSWLSDSHLVFVQVWGAGGGATNVSGGAGGGGAYNERMYRASDLSANEDIAVGAGGNAGSNASGSSGGDSHFGNNVVGKRIFAYGGGGGRALSSGYAGGGGGTRSAGTNTSSGGGAGYSGQLQTFADQYDYDFSVHGIFDNGGQGASPRSTSTGGSYINEHGGSSTWGGGGGGIGHNNVNGNGGNSLYGGGGGGSSATGVGGASLHGGKGGDGATGTAQAGSIPAGGGGGSGAVGGAGNGARGEVRVFIFG